MIVIEKEKTTKAVYSAYKDSGVDWLGEVPAHWEVVKMKYLFKDYSEKGKPEAELLSVTQSQGVVPRSWVATRMVMPSGNLESFKFIAKGDFAISLRSFEGGLEYCHHDGIISPAYTVLRARRKIEDGYYKYLFKSPTFISELQTSVVGIREGKNISYPQLSYSFMPIPPLPEQRRIADYLDQKCAQIDLAIAQKERMIALLEERQQIVIQRAVSQGLDSGVEMKDSGVAWLGEIPESWEVLKIRDLMQLKSDKGHPDYEVLSVYREYGVIPKSSRDDNHNATSLDTSTYKAVKPGDFVINKMKAWQGSMGVSNYKGIVSPAYITCEVDTSKIYSRYLHNLLRCKKYISEYNRISYGVRIGQWDIRFEDFKQLPLLLPPMEEQIFISNIIDEVVSKTARAVLDQRKGIKALREYREVLIDEVVRGRMCLGE
ncbi:restriction endonuclease subunit S [Saprospira grandis]|uniref:Type I restriction-modification system n=1 Tax=Saprospira grandis (strain Lewin) TaxID=984262 RepID=H6L8P1_SAPGL|nr:restriction endonuclease subunit S [Saprospira grandis]AFC26847.1 type I restriction-modification system [Saprospira grandis str. Lewin]